MINVLIIEDTALHFEIIADAMKNFKHLVKIFPINAVDKDRNLNDLNCLIENLQAKQFQEVIDFYNNIDLFIIDATLTPKSDTLGIDFLKFLQKKYDPNFKAIVISNTEEIGQLVDRNRFPFISKIKHGIHDNFSKVLSEAIENQYKLSTQDESNKLSILQLLRRDIQKHGWPYGLHSFWIYLTENIQRNIIDKTVVVLFYLLLLVTIVFGGYNILHSIHNAFLDLENETLILRISEHIFLNLLPIFIVFGFFHYYKTHIRVFLLEGNTYSIDDKISTKTMNLSKTLFFSSIISYVLIKIIEEIFIEKIDNITRLLSFGLLLISLMAYYLLLEKNNH